MALRHGTGGAASPLRVTGLPKFPPTAACARLRCVSQANPLRLFITHAWEMSDDYLRVFEYLESARNFFYKQLQHAR